MMWGALCIAAMFWLLRYDNPIASIIGIILGLAGVHQIWLGITGKSKQIMKKGPVEGTRHTAAILAGEQYEPLEGTDSKTKNSNQLKQKAKDGYFQEIGRELRRSYDKLCNEAFESFKELAEDIELPENLEFEIASLLYFAFDFGMASGTETEIRNKIRDAFLEAKPIDELEAERTSSRVEEYLNELRTEHDRERQMLLLGNVFAKHTGNEDDISVVTWASIQYGTTFRFVTDLMKEQLVHLLT